MLSFVLQRLAQAVVTVLGVITFVFVLIRLTGDPVALMVSDTASQAEMDAMRASLGLSDPIWQQYTSFLANAVNGDLGVSLFEGRPASQVIVERLPATLQLAVPSFVIGICIAFLLAMWVRWTGSRRLQQALLWITLAREAIPTFWFPLLLILLFSVKLGWLPALGSGRLEHMILPVASLATIQIAVYLRLFHSALGTQYRSEYIRTARAAGIGKRTVLMRYALPNAVLPVVTLAGLNLAILLSGTVVTESVFSWPGVGRTIVAAVENSDFPVVQAGVIFVASIFIFINLCVDILIGVIDPRTRVSHE